MAPATGRAVMIGVKIGRRSIDRGGALPYRAGDVMDTDHLRKSLMTLHWSTLTLADILQCPTDVVMAWYFGHDVLPPTVAEWLERLVEAHKNNPAPIGGLAETGLGDR